MKTRHDFLKHSALLAGVSAFNPVQNLWAQGQNDKQPIRFIFMTKSSGLQPHEIALPSLTRKIKRRMNKKMNSVSI